MIFDLALGALLALVVLMLRRTQMPAPMRSLLAIVFGFFAMALVISLCTLALRSIHITSAESAQAYFAASAAYSVVATFLGGWVTGDIASTHETWHGAALALVIVLLSLRGFLHPSPGQALWYVLFLATIPPLAAIAGAALASRRLRI